MNLVRGAMGISRKFLQRCAPLQQPGAEIQCLAVKEGYQGHGLGSDLVRSCVELARERGIMEVMAISSSEKFLQNLGFDYSLPDQKRALFYQLRTREDLYREREGTDE